MRCASHPVRNPPRGVPFANPQRIPHQTKLRRGRLDAFDSTSTWGIGVAAKRQLCSLKVSKDSGQALKSPRIRLAASYMPRLEVEARARRRRCQGLDTIVFTDPQNGQLEFRGRVPTGAKLLVQFAAAGRLRLMGFGAPTRGWRSGGRDAHECRLEQDASRKPRPLRFHYCVGPSAGF
jgi:hypothetical protein